MASARLRRRIDELKPCRECAEHGGLFVPGAHGGLRRCGCQRGRLLEKADLFTGGFAGLRQSETQRSRTDAAVANLTPAAPTNP